MTPRDSGHRTRRADAGWRRYLIPGILTVTTSAGGGAAVLLYRVDRLESHMQSDESHFQRLDLLNDIQNSKLAAHEARLVVIESRHNAEDLRKAP